MSLMSTTMRRTEH